MEQWNGITDPGKKTQDLDAGLTGELTGWMTKNDEGRGLGRGCHSPPKPQAATAGSNV